MTENFVKKNINSDSVVLRLLAEKAVTLKTDKEKESFYRVWKIIIDEKS